jgi:hypothetical protein
MDVESARQDVMERDLSVGRASADRVSRDNVYIRQRQCGYQSQTGMLALAPLYFGPPARLCAFYLSLLGD